MLSQHFDQWTRQGYEFDETIKTEALKPAQEALMKLFAVSIAEQLLGSAKPKLLDT